MKLAHTFRCNLCSSEELRQFLTSRNSHGRHALSNEEFMIYKCGACGNYLLGGVAINDAYYKKYYQSDYYSQPGVSFLSRVENILYKFSVTQKAHYIDKVIQNCKSLSLLDIGSGDGRFLSLLPDNIEKYGVEMSKKGYESSKKKGLNIFYADMFDLPEKKKFNVITMWHVLEHIPDPRKAFQKVGKLLEPRGVFIFAVPNSDSLGFKLGKRDWFHLDSPRHLFLPNVNNLKLVLEKEGFELVSIKNEFYDSPLDLFWSVRNSPWRYIIYPLYPLFKLFDRETITVICKKKH